MDKLKQWVALSVVGVLVIGAAGYFLLISPKRTEATEIRLQAEQQLSANSALQTQIQMLKAQAKQLPQQQAKLAAVAAKIPDNPSLPTLIRALTKAADETGVELISLAPAKPAALTPAVAAVSAPVAAPAPGAAPIAGTPAAASATAGLLQSIGITVNVVGGYFQIEQFFDRVENLTRAMKVTGFTLAPGANPLKPSSSQSLDTGRVLTAVVTGNVYMASGRSTLVPTTVVGK